MSNTDTHEVTQDEEVKPLTPGAWCGERYAKLLGREIAEEVLKGGGDDGPWEHDPETRAWWAEFYGELRSLDLRDHEEVAGFLKKHYSARVGDLSDDEISACAEVFADAVQREEF